mgnify:CR=1 FL=1
MHRTFNEVLLSLHDTAAPAAPAPAAAAAPTVKVFDTATGELVRKHQTGGSLAGGVVTYEAGGRQYLAFADGNVSRNAFGALGLPSVVIMALDPKSTPIAVGHAAGTASGRRPPAAPGGSGVRRATPR